jgi:magnesium transporter
MQRDVISVKVDEPTEQVVQKLARFDFIAIPVVDDMSRLVGIVTHDDVLDTVREEATEDAQMSAAVAPLNEGYLETALITMTWKRGVWLTILFFTAAVTAMVLARTPIPQVWLIAFIPLVIASGGNSGNQSATLVITALSSPTGLEFFAVNLSWAYFLARSLPYQAFYSPSFTHLPQLKRW